MAGATIKLFLTTGDARSMRVAEISNWNGKAIAAPRTEIDALIERDELRNAGVYLLLGIDPDSGRPSAYIGEAEVIRERLRQHTAKEFWVQVIVFVSQGENLTKSHIKFLEGRVISEAIAAKRFELQNAQGSGAKLPESDRDDMEVFLGRMKQLLPVLGCDLLVPTSGKVQNSSAAKLICSIRGIEATGARSAEGFVVYRGSLASAQLRPSAERRAVTPRDARKSWSG